MDAQCGNSKYPLIENIPELNSSHKSPYTRVLEHDSTVLVTLLISDTNSTAYPTLINGLYLPYGPGVGLRGLGWRFLTLTERALKE